MLKGVFIVMFFDSPLLSWVRIPPNCEKQFASGMVLDVLKEELQKARKCFSIQADAVRQKQVENIYL